MSTSRPFTFDRVVRIIGTVLIIVLAFWLINTLKNVLLPFCLGCLLAYLLMPLVELNKRVLRIPWRIVAIFLTLFEVAAVVGLILYLIIPPVFKEIHQMSLLIDKYTSSGISAPLIPREVSDWVNSLMEQFNISSLLEEGRIETILSQGSSLLNQVIDFLLHTIEWLLAFIYVIFILLDYEHLRRGFRMVIPPRYRPMADRIGNDIKQSMNRYFRGQSLIALCAAVFYCIGFSIVGIPMAIVLGVTVGVLYLIPYFQYVTLIPVAIICFISTLDGGDSFFLLFGKCLLVYVVAQCICDYILTPKIMGKAMGLNPALILLSLSVWGTLLGIIGMIIALPLTTLMISYYQEYVIAPMNRKAMTNGKSSPPPGDVPAGA